MRLNRKRFYAAAALLALFLAVVVAVGFSSAAYADVGNTHSSGGDWSGDFGDGDDDSGVIALIYYAIRALLYLPFPINVICVAIMVAVFVFASKRRKAVVRNYRGGARSAGGYYGGVSRAVSRGASVGDIYKTDPDFSEETFIAYVKNVFLSVQDAWEAKDWSLVRPFESNELFEIHSRQLNEYIVKNWQPHLDSQEILEVVLYGFETRGGFDIMTVYLRASLYDYLTDQDGRVVQGSRGRRETRAYRLKFKRAEGVKTGRAPQDAKVTNCPNCGAVTNIMSSGKCEYCDSVITTGEYGWVMDEYSAWR